MSTNVSLWYFWHFFSRIMMSAKGWTVAITEKEAYDKTAGFLKLVAEKHSWRGKTVRLTMIAWRAKEESVLLVHRFRTDFLDRNVRVVGNLTLPYNGKEEWEYDQLPSRARHWSLEKPIDLLSLIEAHDRVAKATGCVTIMN